jgi:hypothetical protein
MFDAVTIGRKKDRSSHFRIRDYDTLTRHVGAAYVFIALGRHLPIYAEGHLNTPRITKEEVLWLGKEAARFGQTIVDLIPDDLGVYKEGLIRDASHAPRRIKTSCEGTIVHTCAMAAYAHRYFIDPSRQDLQDIATVRRRMAENSRTPYTGIPEKGDPLKLSTEALVDSLKAHYVISGLDLGHAQSILCVQAISTIFFHNWEDLYSLPRM